MSPAEQQKLAARAEREAAWQRRRQERFAAQDREFRDAVLQHILQEAAPRHRAVGTLAGFRPGPSNDEVAVGARHDRQPLSIED